MDQKRCEHIHEELQKLPKNERDFILWDLLGDYMKDYEAWGKAQPDSIQEMVERDLRVLGQQQFILTKEIW